MHVVTRRAELVAEELAFFKTLSLCFCVSQCWFTKYFFSKFTEVSHSLQHKIWPSVKKLLSPYYFTNLDSLKVFEAGSFGILRGKRDDMNTTDSIQKLTKFIIYIPYQTIFVRHHAPLGFTPLTTHPDLNIGEGQCEGKVLGASNKIAPISFSD